MYIIFIKMSISKLKLILGSQNGFETDFQN